MGLGYPFPKNMEEHSFYPKNVPFNFKLKLVKYIAGLSPNLAQNTGGQYITILPISLVFKPPMVLNKALSQTRVNVLINNSYEEVLSLCMFRR